MGIAILVVVSFSAFLIYALTRPVPVNDVGTPSRSPLDEAERILGARYAHGDISADEYQRMLVVLRR